MNLRSGLWAWVAAAVVLELIDRFMGLHWSLPTVLGLALIPAIAFAIRNHGR